MNEGISSHKNERMSFLTLSSPKGEEQNESLEKSLKLLIMRIRYHYGKFEYFAVRTNEGNGVYHIIFYGPFIPYKWLSDTWKEIRGAWNVNIQSIGTVRSKTRVSRYVVQQYLADQVALVRSSMSKGWLSRTVKEIRQFERILTEEMGLKWWNRNERFYKIKDEWLGTEKRATKRIVWYPEC